MENPIRGDSRLREIKATSDPMLAILHLLTMFVADRFNPRRQLEVENIFLRHQLNIALRRAPPRLRLHRSDRALLVYVPVLATPAQVARISVVLPSMG